MEGFDEEELLFYEAVEGFHITLIGVSCWWDGTMGSVVAILYQACECPRSLLLPGAYELTAVVCLD